MFYMLLFNIQQNRNLKTKLIHDLESSFTKILWSWLYYFYPFQSNILTLLNIYISEKHFWNKSKLFTEDEGIRIMLIKLEFENFKIENKKV